MKIRASTFLMATLAAMILAAAGAQAQRLPFAPGEHAVYQVRLGSVPVGTGTLSVRGRETVQGEETYHTVMTLQGGTLFYTLNDRYESWLDTDGLFSRRFHQNLREGSYRRNRTYDFDPARRTFRRRTARPAHCLRTSRWTTSPSSTIARTLPLEVGATYRLQRYFKPDGNPVVLQVLRRETIAVPAGRFRTIVVRPIIRSDGIFAEDGRAEVWFSDDQYRIPVMIRTEAGKLPGSISLRLRTFRPGR